MLIESGLEVFEGEWSEDRTEASEEEPALYVAAIAYRSKERAPGLWVDAFESPPIQGQVLKALYDEFLENGEIQDVSFEEFVRISEPTVVIVSPEDLSAFARSKEGC